MHEVRGDSAPGAAHPTISPQLPRTLLRGDGLDALLGVVTQSPDDLPAPTPSTVRAVVVGVDGRHLRARELRQRLSGERRDFARAVHRYPGLRHLIIVLRVERDGEPAATRVLDRTAHRAHVELEMRRSRDICVTGVVIAVDLDAGIFIDRLNDRIRHTPIEGSYVVSARQIIELGISATAAEHLL